MSSTLFDEIPKQYSPAESQQRWYGFWEERGYFASSPDPKRKPYTIVIPPPNVTGALHLGHALNNTLQDTLIRWRRMQGYNALWMPGTDHAGIATQAVVERRLLEEEKKSRHDLGRTALVERIWNWKKEYETRILGQLKQMGCSCDWRRTRFTLDATCARAVRHTFFGLFKQQLIYRGQRLVNWDTFLQTAVSDDEVFHETVKGHFWHFSYPVVNPQPGEPERVTFATTRPETMLGDTAVAVHPNPAAALQQAEAELREKLFTAPAKEQPAIQAELDALIDRRQEMLPHLEKLRDMALAGRKLKIPLADREIPLVADEWAKPEMGSGCVKITPAHDPNDYEVGLRQNLPMLNVLNADGTLNATAGKYQGLFASRAARERVVADMDALGFLEKVEDREIDLAHSDRSKTAIEPLLADQWFVRMQDLAQSAMDAVSDGRVKIIPNRYAKGYHDWLAEKRDWPVSRQLWWGHQIPVWKFIRGDYHNVVDVFKAVNAVADIYREPSDNVAVHFDPQAGEVGSAEAVHAFLPSVRNIYVCVIDDDDPIIARLESAGFVREEDVLDTWFSSALWPLSTLGWPAETPELTEYYPTDALVTSRDIITLWVARMVIMGLFNRKGEPVGRQVPFRDVFIHPKILDGYGETMSKSKGNGVDPLDVIEKFGADALRFALAYLTTETQDVRMPVEFECPHCGHLVEQTKKNRVLPRIECSKCQQPFSTQWAKSDADTALPRGPVVSERFELARNFCNKLWNAARFALLNFEGYEPGPVADSDLLLEDRWLLSRLSTVTQKTTEALEEFRFSDAARQLYDFAWDEFCSFYLEMAKARLQDPAGRPVAQRIFAHTLDTLLRLLHPTIPFLTEEIWHRLAQAAPVRGLPKATAAAESVMIAAWPTPDLSQQNPEIEARFARFQTVLTAIRDIRSRQNILPKQQIEFSVRCDEEAAALLQPMAPYFLSMAGAKATAWGPNTAPPAIGANLLAGGVEVFVDLAGLIDKPAEIARNEKERAKLAQMIGAKQAKLAGGTFVERAPAEVVAKERASLGELEEKLAAIDRALVELRK